MLTTVIALATSTAGCSLIGGGRSAKDEATSLARALSAGRLTGLSYAGGTAAQAQAMWRSTVAGLGSSRARVVVRDVTEGASGRPSTARLAWTWTLAGTSRTWRYLSTATVEPAPGKAGDDGWRVRLAPTLLHPDLTTGDRLSLTDTLAPRAEIRGAGGATLVTDRPVQRIGIDKTRVGASRQAASARALARALGIDAPSYAARVKAAGAQAFVEALVVRQADAAQVLGAGVRGIAGLSVVRDTLPLAPTRDFARAVLGTVGPVTAELVKKSAGVYRTGDEAGLSGLEARYDTQLRGTPGRVVSAVDARRVSRVLFRADPTPGTPLATTLVPRLQRAAERSLAGVRPASALVAIRPSTGDLLAVANGTGSHGLSTATVGQYAPGSTFKVVSSLALLRSGLRPSSVVTCPATTVVDGKSFKNYSDYPASGIGRIPFSTAVANSCNTAFIGQRDAVSQADLADAAASLGLGVDHDLGFPAFLGSVPRTAAQAGSATGHAASMIGQGRVVASPMAMAAAAASVGRGGLVVPRLLPAQKTATTAPAHPLTGTEARQLRSLMRGVVLHGSGSFLASLPGAPVLAKTGTAEFGTTVPLRTHAWMIAVHGDLAVAVFVDVGASGSGTAGPVLETFLRAAG